MTYPKTERQARFIALADSVAGPIAARAAGVDAANDFPWENFRDLHRAGYLTLTIPERLGGHGANVLEFALAQERIAHACGATGLASAMHLSLLGRIAELEHWPAGIYAGITRDVLARGALINAVNSEPSLGSPSRGGLPSTTAERTPTGWRINGRKSWASLAPALSYFYSLATVIDDEAPRRGNFLIPANLPGVRVEPTWDNLGMRGTASHDVIFDQVEVAADALLPAEGPGASGESAVWHLVPSAAVYLGVAQAARDEAVNFAKNRRPNGMSGPIAELQTVQHKVAEMDLLLLQARTLLYGTAEQWVSAPETRPEISWHLITAKYTVTNAALRVTDLALRVAGSASLANTSPLQRFFRDARTALGHPPMEDAVLTTIGKTALGINNVPNLVAPAPAPAPAPVAAPASTAAPGPVREAERVA